MAFSSCSKPSLRKAPATDWLVDIRRKMSANKAINADGGNVIIFAGAPLSGFKKIVQEEISVPIIDCAEAALKQAELSVFSKFLSLFVNI